MAWPPPLPPQPAKLQAPSPGIHHGHDRHGRSDYVDDDDHDTHHTVRTVPSKQTSTAPFPLPRLRQFSLQQPNQP